MPAPSPSPASVLRTSVGEFPLQEYRLRLAGREWTVLHTDAVLTFDDEQRFLRDRTDRLPYGVVLWPAAIALAHEIAARADAMRGARVLELGAGTGLPGIVAASLGAHVVQTDRHELAMSVCRRNGERNGERNGVTSIEYRAVDWAAWVDVARYDVILGSDILYADTMHPPLSRIFDANLAPGGRVLLSDPFRAVSLKLLEAMETAGWQIALSKWTIGEDAAPRSIGVYELSRHDWRERDPAIPASS